MPSVTPRSGLFKAVIDAIFGSDDNLAGQAVTELTAPLLDTSLTVNVRSTLRFGENIDDTTDALFLVGGEIILASGRTLTSFTGLTRGVDTTRIRPVLPVGTLVYDLSKNRTALDHVRRGLWVRTARLADLDVVGRNLGLHKCPGIDEETWRALIQVMAYLPNQPVDAFRRVLDVYPGVGMYTLIEEAITNPDEVFIEIVLPILTGSVRGRFYLNGGTPGVVALDGVTVPMPYPVLAVLGVRAQNVLTDRGERDPAVAPDLYGAGSFLGNNIILGAPVVPGTLVLADWTSFTAHYLAANETVHYPSDGDFFPYLSDPSATVSCLLDQVRAAGVRVTVRTVL